MNHFMIAALWLAWIAGVWLGWQLLRQNGRILLRLDELEKRLNELEFGESEELSGLPIESPAPDFDLPDLNGGRHSLSQFRGKPLLLVFFNPACGFCREMAPRIALAAAGIQPAVEGGILPPGGAQPSAPTPPRPHNVPSSATDSAGLEARLNGRQGCPPLQLLIISTGDAVQNRALFNEHKVEFPILLQKEMEVATAYKSNGTPSGYLINPEGKITSELAMGADALLALANGSPHPQPLSHPMGEGGQRPGEGQAGRESRFANRTLARSKIKRDGLKAGTPAPDFRLPRLDGRGELALADLRGKRVLLVFSSPGCGPCEALAPELEKFHRTHPETELVMVSKGEPKENRAKVKEHNLTFPIVLQQQWEISRLYAMFATPVAYLIDEAGVITADAAVGADGIQTLMSESAAVAIRT